MNLERRISAFAKLGEFFIHVINFESRVSDFEDNVLEDFRKIVKTINIKNPWFIENNVLKAIESIAYNLTEDKLNIWLKDYRQRINYIISPKTIAVIMAGNIPIVGFFDFLTVVISGNKFLGKLSSDDKELLPAIADILYLIEPDFRGMIGFSESRLSDFDVVIATGSDNTSRYFESYFGKYPHIIRKNRNSIAILTGQETDADLKALSNDIFMYFGRGCRCVSKLYIPKGYSFNHLFEIIKEHQDIGNHSKYYNNYQYNRAIYLINKEEHLDNGFLLMKEDKSISSPVSVLYYEYYTDMTALLMEIDNYKEKIQCIIGNNNSKAIPFGKSQLPELWDYSDNVNTLEFILSLE